MKMVVYNIILLLALSANNCSTNSQKAVYTSGGCEYYFNSNNIKIYTKADTSPAFEEGTISLLNYIDQNFKLKKEDILQGTFGVIILIKNDGIVESARVYNKSESEYSDPEINLIKVLNDMPPWNPAICDGKRVNFEYVFPLRI